MSDSGGSSADWEALINFQSAALTEIKNLLGEAQAQSRHAARTLRLAVWTLVFAILTFLATAAVPFLVA